MSGKIASVKVKLIEDLSDFNHDCTWENIFMDSWRKQVSRVLKLVTSSNKIIEYQLYYIDDIYILLDNKNVSYDDESSLHCAINEALTGKSVKDIMAQIYENYSLKPDSHYMFKVARWLACYDEK